MLDFAIARLPPQKELDENSTQRQMLRRVRNIVIAVLIRIVIHLVFVIIFLIAQRSMTRLTEFAQLPPQKEFQPQKDFLLPRKESDAERLRAYGSEKCKC